MNFPDPLGLDPGGSSIGLTPLFLISGRKQLIGIRGAGIDIERRVQFYDGNVGPIGGISQKAVAARKHGAELFLVPACPDGDNPCHDELARPSIARATTFP